MKKILAGLLITSSFLFANSSAQININDDTLEIGTDIYLNKYYDVNNNSNYYMTLRHLRVEDDYKPTKSLSSLGLKLVNPLTDNYGISLGLGIKSVYVDQDSLSFISVPLTLNGRVEINEVLYVDLDVGYAPKVLSFSDAQSYTDIQARVNYKILANGYIYVGGRNIEAKYKNSTWEKFDSSAFLGLEIKF